MTRRAKKNRPPRLPDQQVRQPGQRDPGVPRTAGTRARLVNARVSGQHPTIGRAALNHAVARLVSGAPDARLGLDVGAVSREEVWAAITAGWGTSPDGARVVIEPDCTLAGFGQAVERVREIGRGHGRIAVATARPASLLPLAAALARTAIDAGADVLACERWEVSSDPPRVLWWHDHVAVLSDGRALLADDSGRAGGEWLFAVGRPDLVVADHGFAAAATAAGHETLALADLDVPVLGLAALRGLPVHLVPLVDGCPPAGYDPLVELADPSRGPELPAAVGPGDRGDRRDPDAKDHVPHSTTQTPEAYAHPESGGEG